MEVVFDRVQDQDQPELCSRMTAAYPVLVAVKLNIAIVQDLVKCARGKRGLHNLGKFKSERYNVAIKVKVIMVVARVCRRSST